MKTLLFLVIDTLILFAAARRVEQGTAILIDVREPAEWADTGVATPAVLLPRCDPRGDRTQWKPFLEKHPSKELIVFCRSVAKAVTSSSGRKLPGPVLYFMASQHNGSTTI
jgi:rhodanese-related sulfurtransferase